MSVRTLSAVTAGVPPRIEVRNPAGSVVVDAVEGSDALDVRVEALDAAAEQLLDRVELEISGADPGGQGQFGGGRVEVAVRACEVQVDRLVRVGVQEHGRRQIRLVESCVTQAGARQVGAEEFCLAQIGPGEDRPHVEAELEPEQWDLTIRSTNACGLCDARISASSSCRQSS